MDDFPRVLGVETRPCENCGKDLAVNTWADGSTSVVACDVCWPAKETASADPAVVERVVDTVVTDPVVADPVVVDPAP